MKVLLVVSLFLACLVLSTGTQYKRVCYYTNWSQWRQGIGKYKVNNVDPFLCTHIIFAFAYFHETTGEIYPIEGQNDLDAYIALVALKQQNPDLKVTLAMGGWNFGSLKFSNMVADPVIRGNFVASAVSFLRQYGFDGLDLDWEYPGSRGGRPEDKANFVILCQELVAAFEDDAQKTGKTRLLLTAAVPAGRSNAIIGYDIPALSGLLDFFNLMVYDLHGGWDGKTGHNSALYPADTDEGDDKYLTMDEVAKWWHTSGVPKDKIVVGMATYGHSFTLSNPSNNGVGAPASTGPNGQYTGQSGFWSYYEVCLASSINGVVKFDDESKVPYYVRDNVWVSYDNEQSLRLKAAWLKKEGYSGFMIWSLDLDDFNKVCSTSTRKYPLINAIIDELEDTSETTTSDQTTDATTTEEITEATTEGPTDQTSTAESTEGTTQEQTTQEQTTQEQTTPVGGSTYKRVCYYTNWSQWRQGIGKYKVNNVDPFLCTHIIFAFAYFRETTGEIYPIEGQNDLDAYIALVALKQQNPDLKVTLAMGGWNFGSLKFSNMVADPVIRGNFVASAVSFLRQYGFDGLDLDWEYPGSRGGRPGDKANFVILCQELVAAFEDDAQKTGKTPLLLTAAVPAGRSNAILGYDIPALSGLLDFFNLMVYDLHGGWDGKTGHNSALYPADTDEGDDKYLTMDEVAKWWHTSGVPKDKIVVGMATYGHSFTLSNPSNNGVGAPASTGPNGQYTGQSGFWSYYEVCLASSSNGVVKFDDESKVPYYVRDNVWVSFDNEQSLRLKAAWLKKEGYSGFMIWSLDLDDFNKVCSTSTRKYPLINAIIDELGQPTDSTTTEATTEGTEATTEGTEATTEGTEATTEGTEATTEGTEATTEGTEATTEGTEATTEGTEATTEGTTQEQTTPGGGVFSCEGKEDGHYPHPTDCSKFYQCANGIAYEYSCPAGLHWDVAISACNWPELANCAV